MKSGRGSGVHHVLFQHDNYETKTSKLAVETFQTADQSLEEQLYLRTQEDYPNWRQRWKN